MTRALFGSVLLAVFFVALPVFAEEAAPALRCTTGPHSGTYDGEAETATQITCDELRRLGARGDVEVTVSKLGTATFLSVRDATGETRRLQIGGIEEVPIAAPRVAEALVQRTSVKSTQQVDNVVEAETQAYRKQKGEALVGIGIAGTHVVGVDSLAMPEFNLRGAYETLDFAAVADLRVGGLNGENVKQNASLLSIGGGVRYFFTRSDFAPFAGGGLSFTSMTYEREWAGEANGLGAYAEAGVEGLRTHKSRLAFDLRVDAPFYQVSLWRDGYASRTIYAMPITFAIAFSYRGI